MESGRWLTGLAVLVMCAVAWAWWPKTTPELPSVSAAPPSAPADDAPTLGAAPEDPEELAVWYEAQVRDALDPTRREERRPHGEVAVASLEAPARVRGSAAGAGPRTNGEAAPAPTPDKRLNSCAPDDMPPELRDNPNINWSYLCDIFAGRVTGIPNEQKAGLTIPEIDQLGEIPYVEELRADPERASELRDLGFRDELPGWPACLRTGSCRRDPESSPPT